MFLFSSQVVKFFNDLTRCCCISSRFSKAKSGADLDSDDGIEPTVLMTHRADVDAINKRQLHELPSKAVHFEARDSGAFQGGSCPARRSLTLKVGAQVMLVRTLDARRGLVNGARGVVTRLGGATGLPTVRFACGAEEIVRRERWTVSAQGRTMGAREQLPLDLGWALSVHKSQVRQSRARDWPHLTTAIAALSFALKCWKPLELR